MRESREGKSTLEGEVNQKGDEEHGHCVDHENLDWVLFLGHFLLNLVDIQERLNAVDDF